MTFRPLQADDPADRVHLRKVFDATPTFMQAILGRAPMVSDVDEFFNDLPRLYQKASIKLKRRNSWFPRSWRLMRKNSWAYAP